MESKKIIIVLIIAIVLLVFIVGVKIIQRKNMERNTQGLNNDTNIIQKETNNQTKNGAKGLIDEGAEIIGGSEQIGGDEVNGDEP